MYVKNSDSGLVINTNDAHYKEILARRKERAARESLEIQFADLKNELVGLKTLLQQVITGNNNG
jgi:hypothetical protein